MNNKGNKSNETESMKRVYFNFDKLGFSDVERIIKLIQLDSWLAGDFSEYCCSCKIQDPDLDTVCDWVGAGFGMWKYRAEADWLPVSLKCSVAEILSLVICSKENIDIVERYSDMEGGAGIGIKPAFPWEMSDRSKTLTREEAADILKGYIGMVADDMGALP